MTSPPEPSPTRASRPGTSRPGFLRFGVVDLETSGLVTERHRILQVGLVVVEVPLTGPAIAHVTDRWDTMVRLRWPLQRLGPRHVHGIRRRDLWGAPRLGAALATLATRLEGSIFTAHNAAFDAAFLERAARSEGVTLEIGPRLCTLRMSRRLDPGRRDSHRLADVCQRYDVALDRPHDALDDALATAAVLPHLLRAHGVTDASHLEPFYDPPARSTPSAPAPPGGSGRPSRPSSAAPS